MLIAQLLLLTSLTFHDQATRQFLGSSGSSRFLGHSDVLGEGVAGHSEELRGTEEPEEPEALDYAEFISAFEAGNVVRMTRLWSEQSPMRAADLKRITRLAFERGTQIVKATVDDERQIVHLELRDEAGLLLQRYDVAFRDSGIWSIAVVEATDDLQRAREQLIRAVELLDSGEIDQALDLFTSAMKLGDAVGHPSTKSTARRGLGTVAYLRGDAENATKHFQAAYEIARAANDRSNIGRALDKLALIDRVTGNFDRGEARLDEALAIFRETGERLLAGYMLNGLGNFASSRSSYKKAQGHYREAMAIFEELGNEQGIHSTLNNLGLTARVLGQFDESVALLTRVLEATRKTNDAMGMAYAHSNLGTVYAMQGNLSEAVSAYQEGLVLFERLGRTESIALALGNIGELYRLLGNHEQSRAHFERALAMAEKFNFKSAIAQALHNLGQLRLDDDDPRGAMALYEKALAIDTEVGNRAGMGRDIHNIGQAQMELGDRAAARRSFEKSLAIAEELEAPEMRTNALGALALIADDANEGLELSRRTVELATELGLPEVMWHAHLTHGRALRRVGRLDEARAEIDRAVTIVEELRRVVPGGEVAQEQAFENLVDPYHEMTELLVQQGDVAGAFEYAERAKGRVLLDVLQNGRPDLGSRISADERAREAALASDVMEISRDYRETLDAGKRTNVVSAKLRKARLDYDAFITNLYAAHPQLRAERGDVTPLRAKDLRALLGNGTADALLAFVVTEHRTYLFSATRNKDGVDLRVETIDIAQRELEAEVLRFRKLLASHDLTYGPAARALYDRLLKPVAARLQGRETICIVPDGPLWELPFQALQPKHGEFLLDRHAIYSVPSLTVLKEISARKRQSGSTRLLAFGDPLIAGPTRANAMWRDEPLAPLPHTGAEIRAIASLYGTGNSRIHLRGAAREEVVKAEAGDYDVLHFATHGILDDQNALYSRLVFSPPSSKSEDGLLEAREIMRLDLRANLAVLSACETARGRLSTGEGVIGMSWALFVAGVPATVVSQWKVDSTSTSDLMIEFHRNLRIPGRSKAEALRRAALKTRANPAYRHPFYWAPFVVIGSTR